MSIVISVPRIVAWVKRQQPTAIIGYPGSGDRCVVATYASRAYGICPMVQPYLGGGDKPRIHWTDEQYLVTRPLSAAVTDLAQHFDDFYGGSTGRAVTAQAFLEWWQARNAQ